MSDFAIALHGGAGAVKGRDYTEAERHLGELASSAGRELDGGAAALDVVESVVAAMESSGLYVAGRGSAPNSAGYVEQDASIMDGSSKAAGAVALLSDFENPVRVARGIMDRTEHVMLAGKGAAEFARREGFAEVAVPDSYYRLPVGVSPDDIERISHGTVGAVALDRDGRLAAATSTGGTFGKLEGRVGDSPLIACGTWADDAIAVSCTGVGEYFIRTGAALSVAGRYRAGERLDAAIAMTLDEVGVLGGDGGIIACSANGEFAMAFNSEGMKRAALSSTRPLTTATF